MMTAAGGIPTRPDPRAVRRGFDRLSRSFDAARWLYDDVRSRLLERLDPLVVLPTRVLDLGCGTGHGSRALAERYAGARILALDASIDMCRQAAQTCRAVPEVAVIAGNAERLPVHEGQVDLVFANLALPWCAPEEVFRECARVLSPGGALVFATLGPDSLKELRRAWATIDAESHVHAFMDMHDLGDLMLAAGLLEPIVDSERLTLSYSEPGRLLEDLRTLGARNACPTRSSTLTGRRRWQQFAAALDAGGRDGRWPLTLELVFGHAWGGGRRQQAVGGEFAFPLERLRSRR